jgi:hypothetical protein
MTTELKPHQRQAVKKFFLSDSGIILFHSVGSGKTLSALIIAREYLRNKKKCNVLFIVPASLKKYYYHEQDKHNISIDKSRITILSYGELIRLKDLSLLKADLLIVDEAHRLRNTSTLTHKTIRKLSKKADKILLLTGSLIYNSEIDFSALINVVAKQSLLPVEKKKFDKQFIDSGRKKIIDIFLGFPQEKKLSRKGIKEIRKISQNYIHYYSNENSLEYPQIEYKIIGVPLSAIQLEYYKAIESNIPLRVRFKIWHQLPLNKKELRVLNAFSIGLRQICNSLNSFSKHRPLPPIPKIERIINEVKLYSRNVIYSNFIEAGLNPIALKLEKFGITYTIATGKITKKKLISAIHDFNSAKKDCILISSCAGEGINLLNVDAMHIVEPHFNLTKIEQVIGRVCRLDSHKTDLLERPKVAVRQYISTFPKSLLYTLFHTKTQTIEEYLMKHSHEKETIKKEIITAISMEKVIT